MCAPDICECEASIELVDIWGAIPEEKLRKFGRIFDKKDYSAEERTALATDGPYDAPVIIFDF